MKNVLIISQYFAPKNSVAAIRFTKVVKYLARTKKYHFYVVCYDCSEDHLIDNILKRDIEEVEQYVTILPVKERGKIRVTSDKGSLKINDGSTKVKSEKTYLNFLYELNDIITECMFVYRGRKILKKYKKIEIDVMISTYGHVGAHLLGLNCLKKHQSTRWIADYRDPIRWKTIVGKLFEIIICKKTDRKAAYVTGASTSYLGSNQFPGKFKVIYNGFDEEDVLGIGQRGTKNASRKKFTICYTGRIYPGRQDMSILFKVIRDLAKENAIELNDIRVLYAGEQFAELYKQAVSCEMDEILVNCGILPREEALILQKRADILCLMVWNNCDDKDIVCAKMLEYFMMNKPIIAIVSGNAKNSFTRRILEDANAGCVYEEADGINTYLVLKQWLYNKYCEYKSDEGIICNINREIVEQFTSKRMAQRFESLI